jgi:hypothetical protein
MLMNILHCPEDICLTSMDVMMKSAEVCCIATVLFRKAQTETVITIAATTRRTIAILSEIPALLRLIPLMALMRHHMLNNVT